MNITTDNSAVIAALNERIAELEKALLGVDRVDPLLKKLLFCCDGLSVEYAQSNYGAANEWVRHIDSAYQNYQSSIDEYQEEALKEQE